MFRHILSILLVGVTLGASAQQWIPIPPEAKPHTRWWWLGSAVDSANIRSLLETYGKAGLGGVEITPIYGVQGNEAHELQYLSAPWMRMLGWVETCGAQSGVRIDMATGTGWPFGGPWVATDDGACKAIFQSYGAAELQSGGALVDVTCADARQRAVARLGRVMLYDRSGRAANATSLARIDVQAKTVAIDVAAARKQLRLSDVAQMVVLYVGRTGQQVKRAAPGGEGLVIDHFDKGAVESYLSHIAQAFRTSRTPAPHAFFNDSYEVYGADWTPQLLERFRARWGYALEDHFPAFLLPAEERTEQARRILSDYRELMGELLLRNFTTQWTDWAHEQGAVTRNQAHGSPANLLDVYAAVDIPECESFGLSDFGIRGLRRDEGHTKKNDSDISMLKYASSAAHISGKRLTSSETFTWLTEHFRTSLSQCKPDLDLMFVAGVNHVFFHGTAYSPAEAEWPGWRFYASVDMSPQNPQWNAMPAFSDYVARCQSFLQWGESDADFLVYLPYYDMIEEQPERLPLFDIHHMAQRAPRFIAAIQGIIRLGYDVDYVSDKYVLKTRPVAPDDLRLTTTGQNRYAAIIVPGARLMPERTLRHLVRLAEAGTKVIFVGDMPVSNPGLARLQQQDASAYEALLASLKAHAVHVKDYDGMAELRLGGREALRTEHGLSVIRRRNAQGYHYFVSNLTPDDVDAFVPIAVPFASAEAYDPMTGRVGRMAVSDGRLYLRLASGESMVIRTYDERNEHVESEPLLQRADRREAPVLRLALSDFTLTFPESAPMRIAESWRLKDGLKSWTELGDERLCRMMGTGRYATTFRLDGRTLEQAQEAWLDLGDVRESVRLVVNGKEAGVLFAVPFRADIRPYLRTGKNELVLYVTNLAANRIAQMDRDGVAWRRFKEINVVNLQYGRENYADWAPMPAGLLTAPMLQLW